MSLSAARSIFRSEKQLTVHTAEDLKRELLTFPTCGSRHKEVTTIFNSYIPVEGVEFEFEMFSETPDNVYVWASQSGERKYLDYLTLKDHERQLCASELWVCFENIPEEWKRALPEAGSAPTQLEEGAWELVYEDTATEGTS